MSTRAWGNLHEATTLAILAGGEGSRMGTPKANLTIDSRPILEYLLEELTWPGPTLLVTAPGREHPPGWQRFDLEVSDPTPGGGPLRGVLTAMEHLTTPLLLVLTVDMPAIRQPQCEVLLDRLIADPSTSGVMMRRTIIENDPQRRVRLGRRGNRDDVKSLISKDGANADGPIARAEPFQIEPFPCAFRASARPIIEQRLFEDRRSIHALLHEPGFVTFDAPSTWNPAVWTNLNTPKELEAFILARSKNASSD